MKAVWRRWLACIAACALFCLPLAGCVNITFESKPSGDVSILPTPAAQTAPSPVGDSRARYSQRTLLYYSNSEGQLTSALRLLYVAQEESFLENVLRALLDTPYSSSGLAAVAPAGTKCLECTLSEGLATVNLSAEAISKGFEAFWVLRTAVVKTLMEQQGVTAVNVLVEGRACEGNGFPLGVSEMRGSDPSYELAQWENEYEKFQQGRNGASLERKIAVYLPDSAGDVLLPEVREIQFTDVDFADEIVADWLKAGIEKEYDESFLPAAALSGTSAEISITPEGARIVTIRIPSAVLTNGGDRVVCRAAGALAITLCRFLPNIDAFRVYAGSSLISSLMLPGETLVSENGLFLPSRLEHCVGSTVKLYFPAENGRLRKETCALPGLTHTPRELIALLNDCESGLFPQGITVSDILGIRLEDGIAYVNLSANLYSACQSFDAARESAFLYAIVNTLVDCFPIVSRVQFLVAGEYADTFAGTICIRGPLLPNPGIVSE